MKKVLTNPKTGKSITYKPTGIPAKKKTWKKYV
jgi:hypothetical protein